VWADGRQQLGGLTLALMALLLALAVNVGVGTMVESFRLTFSGYLEQRLAPELYVTARDDAQAAAVAEWLEAQPEVEVVLPLWRADSRFRDWPTEVYGFRDDRTYRESWPLLGAVPGAWDAVAEGEAAMVSEQLARRFGLAPGDAIALPTPRGDWAVTVAGVYPDYGNTVGQVMVSLGELEARFDDIRRLQLGARAAPEDVPGLIDGHRRAVRARGAAGGRPGAGDGVLARRVRPDLRGDGGAERADAGGGGDRAADEPAGAVGAAAGAGGAALGAGVPRRVLAGLEMGRALALAAGTALLALPLGLAVAWVLTAVINVRAFGWRLPVHLFPGDWALLFAMALGVAFLAALMPVWRLRRAQPADLMRGFSNER
jgi:putative ABC transport system permease protein